MQVSRGRRAAPQAPAPTVLNNLLIEFIGGEPGAMLRDQLA